MEKWIVQTAQRMGSSAICLNIFTKDYASGMDSLLQFALAIMLDKPIYLLAEEGVVVPEHVKRIASAIEFYKPDDDGESMKAATLRLLAAAQAKGFAA
jgi:hypothetical protein